MPNRPTRVLGLLLASVLTAAADTEQQSRPYEFSFNIEDFQHRYEKRNSAGIVTGEYGFITADGVYHETAYATDENGNFLITKMKNRKITSLQVAEEIFKGKPEVAKRVIEVLAKSCSGCGIPVEKSAGTVDYSGSSVAGLENSRDKQRPLDSMKNKQSTPSRNINNEQEIRTTSKSSIIDAVGNSPDPKIPELDNEIDRSAPNDFHYRFNYNISSHGHQETGYRDGNKDGAYRTIGPNGTDTNVQYLSNEFGHQPNITFVNRQDTPNGKDSSASFVFKWIYEKR